MSEQELKATVEMCWRVAGTVNLVGVVQPLVVTTGADGAPLCSGVRFAVFQTLLAHCVPQMMGGNTRVDSQVQMVESKEDWQQ